jgi:hypothetical protein
MVGEVLCAMNPVLVSNSQVFGRENKHFPPLVVRRSFLWIGDVRARSKVHRNSFVYRSPAIGK